MMSKDLGWELHCVYVNGKIEKYKLVWRYILDGETEERIDTWKALKTRRGIENYINARQYLRDKDIKEVNIYITKDVDNTKIKYDDAKKKIKKIFKSHFPQMRNSVYGNRTQKAKMQMTIDFGLYEEGLKRADEFFKDEKMIEILKETKCAVTYEEKRFWSWSKPRLVGRLHFKNVNIE